MSESSDNSDVHRVHQAFLRRPLFFGVEMRWIGLEVCFTGALVFALGFNITSVVLVAAVYYGLHRLLKWATSTDQQALDLFVQSLCREPFYQSHPPPKGEGDEAPPTSVPTLDS